MHAATEFGKREWVELFRAIGLDEAAMRRWHGLFERRFPEAHRGFLSWLGESESEVERICRGSRDWAAG